MADSVSQLDHCRYSNVAICVTNDQGGFISSPVKRLNGFDSSDWMPILNFSGSSAFVTCTVHSGGVGETRIRRVKLPSHMQDMWGPSTFGAWADPLSLVRVAA